MLDTLVAGPESSAVKLWSAKLCGKPKPSVEEPEQGFLAGAGAKKNRL